MLILKPLSIDWSVAGAKIPAVTFIAQAGLPARELAHMLDSLVRVSRRVEKNHLVIVVVPDGCPSQPHHSLSECLELEHRDKDTEAWHARFSPQVSSAKHIHPPEERLPGPWSFPQLRTDVDTHGKNHCARPDQNPPQHLR